MKNENMNEDFKTLEKYNQSKVNELLGLALKEYDYTYIYFEDHLSKKYKVKNEEMNVIYNVSVTKVDRIGYENGALIFKDIHCVVENAHHSGMVRDLSKTGKMRDDKFTLKLLQVNEYETDFKELFKYLDDFKTQSYSVYVSVDGYATSVESFEGTKEDIKKALRELKSKTDFGWTKGTQQWNKSIGKLK